MLEVFKCNIDADIHIVNNAAVSVAGVHERERAEIFLLRPVTEDEVRSKKKCLMYLAIMGVM